MNIFLISKVTVIHWPWSKVTQIHNSFKLLFLRNRWADRSQIHVEPPWDEETKICSNGPDHMTNMAAMSIYGKILKNLLLWNQTADDLENWYATLSTRVLPTLFNWWPWVDLDLFYGRVKFGPLCFLWEKGKVMDFYEYQMSRSFIDLRPRSLRFNIFKLLLLRTR